MCIPDSDARGSNLERRSTAKSHFATRDLLGLPEEEEVRFRTMPFP